MKRHQQFKVKGKKVYLLTDNIFNIVNEVDETIEVNSEYGLNTDYEFLKIEFYSTDEQRKRIIAGIKETYEVEVMEP